VVAHHVGNLAVGARRVVRVETTPLTLLRLLDKAVHLTAIDVGDGVHIAVRAAAVDVSRVVKRLVASPALCRVRDADVE
jgi:hypothetical protein